MSLPSLLCFVYVEDAQSDIKVDPKQEAVTVVKTRTNKRVNKTFSGCSIQVFSDLSNVAKSKRSAATNTADVRFEVHVFIEENTQILHLTLSREVSLNYQL